MNLGGIPQFKRFPGLPLPRLSPQGRARASLNVSNVKARNPLASVGVRPQAAARTFHLVSTLIRYFLSPVIRRIPWQDHRSG